MPSPIPVHQLVALCVLATRLLYAKDIIRKAIRRGDELFDRLEQA